MYYCLGGSSAFFGYPNDTDAKNYCRSFRLAAFSCLFMFICMHALAAACIVCLSQNKDRVSMHIETFDPAEYDIKIEESVPKFLRSTSLVGGTTKITDEKANEKYFAIQASNLKSKLLSPAPEP